MSEKKIDVRFRFIDNFTTSFSKSIGTLTAGTKAAETAWKKVGKAGQALSNVGKTLTVGLTVPIVGLAATSVKSFGEVDKTMKLIQSTMGESKWAVADLEDAIKKAAGESVFGMAEASDATLNFARQGFDAKQAADMLAPALALAAGTATDLAEVTSGMGGAMKMFGAESAEASRYADVFAKAQASANTTTTDLFEAVSTAGPIFKTVGWGIEDLATAVAVFGDANISGSEGATAMKTGLARLASPAKDAKEWMNKLGVEIFNADGTMKDFAAVQGLLHNSFAGLTEQEQLQAAASLFGKNQMSKWLTLIQAAPGDVDKLSQAIHNSEGTSNSMSEALMSGLGGSLERLKASFDVFKYTAGGALGEVVQPFIEKITELINKFNEMDPAQQKQIVKFALMVAAVGPVLMIFGNLISTVARIGGAINGMVGFVNKASKVMGALGGASKLAAGAIAFFTSPLGITIGILVAVAAAIALVVTHFDQIKAALGALRDFWLATWEGIKSAFAGVASFISGLLGGVSSKISAISGALGGVGSALAKIGGSGKNAGVSVSSIPARASGDRNWAGGLVQVSEAGGEILDLPHGTRIYPHDVSMQMAQGNRSFSIAKLADTIVVREQADIDAIGDAIVRKIRTAGNNMGGFAYSGNMA